MSERANLWGVGRPLQGATSVTRLIYYVLGQAGDPGLTVDEVVARVGDQLPAGYVWRKYQAYLETNRKKNRRRRPDTLATARARVSEPTPAARARATRFVVGKALQNMSQLDKNGERAAIPRPDGHYVVGLRTPRAMKGLEGKYDESGEITRKAVTTMELVRVLRPYIETIQTRRAAKRNMPTMSIALAAALERWYEAHAVKV